MALHYFFFICIIKKMKTKINTPYFYVHHAFFFFFWSQAPKDTDTAEHSDNFMKSFYNNVCLQSCTCDYIGMAVISSI